MDFHANAGPGVRSLECETCHQHPRKMQMWSASRLKGWLSARILHRRDRLHLLTSLLLTPSHGMNERELSEVTRGRYLLEREIRHRWYARSSNISGGQDNEFNMLGFFPCIVRTDQSESRSMLILTVEFASRRHPFTPQWHLHCNCLFEATCCLQMRHVEALRRRFFLLKHHCCQTRWWLCSLSVGVRAQVAETSLPAKHSATVKF